MENIQIPNFESLIPTKKRSLKKKKVKPTLIPSKPISKPQKPTVNKYDQVHICDIKEFSDIELFLDEIDEVRGIASNARLPERLTFRYKGGTEITWPLYRILNEGYSVLIKVFSAMKKDYGFTKTARLEVLRKITEIRQSWRDPNALPRVLTIPKTGDRVHLKPYWLMEFRDEKGDRRFFRIEDQLKISSNETLKEMQEMLDINNEDEAKFYRQLQLQIEENDEKLGRKTRESRKKK